LKDERGVHIVYFPQCIISDPGFFSLDIRRRLKESPSSLGVVPHPVGVELSTVRKRGGTSPAMENAVAGSRFVGVWLAGSGLIGSRVTGSRSSWCGMTDLGILKFSLQFEYFFVLKNVTLTLHDVIEIF
jgi:hypothetical protein